MPPLRPSSSILAASVVLALAVGGGVGFAAGTLPKDSVTSKQIKNGSVKGADLAKKSVTGPLVKDDSLTGADIDESTLSLPATSGSMVLTGVDFTPRNSGETYNTFNGHDIYFGGAGGTARLSASLDLPIGVTVTSIQVYALDSDAEDVGAFVVRYTPSTYSTTDTSNTAFSSGSPSEMQTLTIPGLSLVTDGNSDLVLNVDLPHGGSRLIGAKVNYSA